MAFNKDFKTIPLEHCPFPVEIHSKKREYAVAADSDPLKVLVEALSVLPLTDNEVGFVFLIDVLEGTGGRTIDLNNHLKISSVT